MSYYGAFIFPFAFFVLLSIQAIREKSYEIFFDFWWGVLLLTIIFIFIERYRWPTKIDYENKIVTINHGPYKVMIKPGALKEIIFKGKSKYIIILKGNIDRIFYSGNSEIKEDESHLWVYTSNGKKKIIDALLSFNPEAKKSYSDL